MNKARTMALLAVAAAACAVFGIGTASATKLCKTTTNPCSAPYAKGTERKSSLRAGNSAIFEISGITEDTCTESTVSGITSNEGSATTTVEAALSSLTFAKCTNTTKVISKGWGEMHSAGGGAGIPTSKGTEVTILAFGGISCVAKTGIGVNVGMMDEPATATSDTVVTINATIPISGFLCPANGQFTAEYTVTAPVPAYVSAS